MGKGPAINFVFYDSVSRLGMADRMDLYLVVPVLRLWLSAILEISNDNFYGIDCQMNLCLILGTYCHQWVNCVAYQFALVFVMSLLSCDELTWSSYRANLIPFIQSVFFCFISQITEHGNCVQVFQVILGRRGPVRWLCYDFICHSRLSSLWNVCDVTEPRLQVLVPSPHFVPWLVLAWRSAALVSLFKGVTVCSHHCLSYNVSWSLQPSLVCYCSCVFFIRSLVINCLHIQCAQGNWKTLRDQGIVRAR